MRWSRVRRQAVRLLVPAFLALALLLGGSSVPDTVGRAWLTVTAIILLMASLPLIIRPVWPPAALAAAGALTVTAASAQSRDTIQIAGSSTVSKVDLSITMVPPGRTTEPPTALEVATMVGLGSVSKSRVASDCSAARPRALAQNGPAVSRMF